MVKLVQLEAERNRRECREADSVARINQYRREYKPLHPEVYALKASMYVCTSTNWQYSCVICFLTYFFVDYLFYIIVKSSL